jgi:hypothetical protein
VDLLNRDLLRWMQFGALVAMGITIANTIVQLRLAATLPPRKKRRAVREAARAARSRR